MLSRNDRKFMKYLKKHVMNDNFVIITPEGITVGHTDLEEVCALISTAYVEMCAIVAQSTGIKVSEAKEKLDEGLEEAFKAIYAEE